MKQDKGVISQVYSSAQCVTSAGYITLSQQEAFWYIADPILSTLLQLFSLTSFSIRSQTGS